MSQAATRTLRGSFGHKGPIRARMQTVYSNP